MNTLTAPVASGLQAALAPRKAGTPGPEAPRPGQVVFLVACAAPLAPPPTVIGRREFIRRLCEANVATALRGAPPFVLKYRPCDGGCVATLECGGEVVQARLPVQAPASRVVVDQAQALGHLVHYLNLQVQELRERRDAGEPLTVADRCVLYVWAAARGQVEPMSDELAERLTGDVPALMETPGAPDRLVWEGVDRITPETPDTDAAAKVAQLLVDIGGEDLVGLAAGLRYAAFEQAVDTPESRYMAALIRSLYLGEPDAAVAQDEREDTEFRDAIQTTGRALHRRHFPRPPEPS